MTENWTESEPEQGSWEAVNITVDSGAVDAVGPKRMAKGLPLLATEAPKQGLFYRVASDTIIAAHGKMQSTDTLLSDHRYDWTSRSPTWQTLGSVRIVCEAGIG